MKYIRLTALLLCLLLLASCARAPKLKYEDGAYHISGLGTYVPAPDCYEARSIKTDKTVARMEQGELDDLLFYAIPDVPAEQMIASANYDLFCAEGTRLPELWEMDAERALVCQSASVTYSLASLSGGELDGILSQSRDGARFSVKEIDPNLTYEVYEIKFESPRYPGFYYSLTYRAYKSDVLVYQVIDDLDCFDVLYEGVPVTTEEYAYVENGEDRVELLAVYNFGKHILYNCGVGECFAIDDTVAKKLENTES